ncbi:MAG: GvpL/GvpF family gas vesicle protein [Acidobacteriota bacterium]
MTASSKPADRAISVYCFAPASELSRSPELGLEAAESKVLGNLAVVFQWVDATDYTGARGERHLADLEWLVPRAEHHQATVSQVSSTVAVLPARFGTLFSDWAGVETWLEPRRDAMLRALQHLFRREEWGIRLLERPRPRPTTPLDASSGASYLLARKQKRDEESAHRDSMEAMAREFGRELASACVELTKVPVRSFDQPLRQAEGDSRVTLAKWAALVDRSALEEFRQHLESLATTLAGDLAEPELSGPWPPYNFCPDF